MYSETIWCSWTMLVMQLSWMLRSFCRTRVRAIIDDIVRTSVLYRYLIYGGHATRKFLISASPTAGAAGGRQETPYKEVIVHCMHRLDMQLAGSKKITVTTGKWPQANYLSTPWRLTIHWNANRLMAAFISTHSFHQPTRNQRTHACSQCYQIW